MRCIDSLSQRRGGAAVMQSLPALARLVLAAALALALGSCATREKDDRTTPRPNAAFALRSWTELKLHAARRMVAANPTQTYAGAAPDPLLAIPVLEIELNADGSVRAIEVLRVPTQAQDTVQIAIDAVRRAGPFGDVSQLPRPWKFTEAFLFDDARRFKPRTLDP